MSKGANPCSRKIHQIIVVAGMVLVSGCAVGPNYVRPNATTPAPAYKGVSGEWKIATPQAHLPKGKWWEAFSDSTLDQLEADAIIANEDIKIALARFEQARATADVTLSDFYPHIVAGADATRQHDSENRPLGNTGKAAGQGYTYDNFAVPFNFSYELDIWGRVRREAESAAAGLQANAADLEGVRLSIAAEVAADYFTLRTRDADKAMLLKTIEAYRKSLQLVHNRRAAGLVSDLDVAQAETILKTTEAQLPDNELQRTKFKNALAVLVGKNPSVFELVEQLLDIAPPLIPAGLPSTLLERRPDVAAAERRMAAANANVGVVTAAFFPTIGLNAVGGFQGINAGTLFNWSSTLWAVGSSLTMPLFEGGKLKAKLHGAEAEYDETVAHYRKTVLRAFADVEDNLAAQRLLNDEYEQEASAFQSADRQLRIADNQYRAGLITYLIVASAQVTALGLQRALVRLRGEQLTATVALIKSLGGGWHADRVELH
ncbi:efflux transporter outer membrane subunit [bacterium]|nr:MAG: efflux transporter outer membrane subunit [bacterium]